MHLEISIKRRQNLSLGFTDSPLSSRLAEEVYHLLGELRLIL
jgi:hypothetical protein